MKRNFERHQYWVNIIICLFAISATAFVIGLVAFGLAINRWPFEASSMLGVLLQWSFTSLFWAGFGATSLAALVLIFLILRAILDR